MIPDELKHEFEPMENIKHNYVHVQMYKCKNCHRQSAHPVLQLIMPEVCIAKERRKEYRRKADLLSFSSK